MSFDGKHAYIATTDSLTRGKHTMLEWVKMSIAGVGGGLALLDLETWQVVKRVKCGEVGGIAVDPDDSRIFCSDFKLKALRIVDPVTLADIAVVSLKSAKAKYFQPRGVGVLPDGSKAYVVCAGGAAHQRADGVDVGRRHSEPRLLLLRGGQDSSRRRSSSAYLWTPTDRCTSPSGRMARRRTFQAGRSVTPW